jgi:cell division protein FtsN
VSGKAETGTDAKRETKAEPKADAGEKWTLQLVATPQKAEAETVAARAKAAGFPARVVLEDKAWKVRLTRAAPKEAADAAAEKLRAAGFKPFAVKAE